MRKLSIRASLIRFANIYSKVMRIKATRFLWIGFIQVLNCFWN